MIEPLFHEKFLFLLPFQTKFKILSPLHLFFEYQALVNFEIYELILKGGCF